jgi:hypothetical protein
VSARSFAFVTFDDKKDAEDAANSMDGKEMDGRVVKANIARPRPPRNYGGGGGGGYGGGGRGGGGGYGGGGYGGGGYDRYIRTVAHMFAIKLTRCVCLGIAAVATVEAAAATTAVAAVDTEAVAAATTVAAVAMTVAAVAMTVAAVEAMTVAAAVEATIVAAATTIAIAGTNSSLDTGISLALRVCCREAIAGVALTDAALSSAQVRTAAKSGVWKERLQCVRPAGIECNKNQSQERQNTTRKSERHTRRAHISETGGNACASKGVEVARSRRRYSSQAALN